MQLILYFYNSYKKLLSFFISPLLLLIMRLYIANIFWKSGVVKLSNWQSTLYLFAYEYKVPILSPEFAAYITTAIEIFAPIFLVLGVMVRVVAFPMLIIVLIVQITFLSLEIHYCWMMLLGVIMVFGAGKFSLESGIYWLLNINNKNN